MAEETSDTEGDRARESIANRTVRAGFDSGGGARLLAPLVPRVDDDKARPHRRRRFRFIHLRTSLGTACVMECGTQLTLYKEVVTTG